MFNRTNQAQSVTRKGSLLVCLMLALAVSGCSDDDRNGAGGSGGSGGSGAGGTGGTGGTGGIGGTGGAVVDDCGLDDIPMERSTEQGVSVGTGVSWFQRFVAGAPGDGIDFPSLCGPGSALTGLAVGFDGPPSNITRIGARCSRFDIVEQGDGYAVEIGPADPFPPEGLGPATGTSADGCGLSQVVTAINISSPDDDPFPPSFDGVAVVCSEIVIPEGEFAIEFQERNTLFLGGGTNFGAPPNPCPATPDDEVDGIPIQAPSFAVGYDAGAITETGIGGLGLRCGTVELIDSVCPAPVAPLGATRLDPGTANCTIAGTPAPIPVFDEVALLETPEGVVYLEAEFAEEAFDLLPSVLGGGTVEITAFEGVVTRPDAQIAAMSGANIPCVLPSQRENRAFLIGPTCVPGEGSLGLESVSVTVTGNSALLIDCSF